MLRPVSPEEVEEEGVGGSSLQQLKGPRSWVGVSLHHIPLPQEPPDSPGQRVWGPLHTRPHDRWQSRVLASTTACPPL